MSSNETYKKYLLEKLKSLESQINFEMKEKDYLESELKKLEIQERNGIEYDSRQLLKG